MKRMRKGIVVLAVAAAGVVGLVGTGAPGAQAWGNRAPVIVDQGDGPAQPQAFGSSWQ